MFGNNTLLPGIYSTQCQEQSTTPYRATLHKSKWLLNGVDSTLLTAVLEWVKSLVHWFTLAALLALNRE